MSLKPGLMALARLPAAGRLGLLLQVLAELAAVPPSQVLVLSRCRGPHDGRGQAPAAANVQAGRFPGVGPNGIGDAPSFRVEEGKQKAGGAEIEKVES